MYADLENTQIPVLWSAPESILEDHYDTKTDTWMIGQFIYEVFTHGCHPYTEVYGTPTEQLLEYVSSYKNNISPSFMLFSLFLIGVIYIFLISRENFVVGK